MPREYRIATEGMRAGPQRVRPYQILFVPILSRPPTTVVAQSRNHRVGGFGFRGCTSLSRKPHSRPETREVGAKAQLQRLGQDQRRDRREALAGSKIYQDYERAFSESTGLPVALRSVESWQLPQHGKRFENPLCALVAQKSRSCAACGARPRRPTLRAGGPPRRGHLRER